MKLRNTTDWSDTFLRRMTAWCCRQIGMPVRRVGRIQFRRKRVGYSGHCWWRSRRIVCSCNNVSDLVAVTTHELFHQHAHDAGIATRRSGEGSSEPQTRWHEERAREAFHADEARLLAEWNAEPKRPAKPKPSVTEARAAKAVAALERWQRKLKLAQTKIRKLKARVRYYERRQAAGGTP